MQDNQIIIYNDDSKVIIFSFLECQKEYPSKHTLKIHLWSEHNIGKDMSCVCTLCDEVKTTKYGLKQHMKAKHEGLNEFSFGVSILGLQDYVFF